jgi:hypothetical protein
MIIVFICTSNSLLEYPVTQADEELLNTTLNSSSITVIIP